MEMGSASRQMKSIPVVARQFGRRIAPRRGRTTPRFALVEPLVVRPALHNHLARTNDADRPVSELHRDLPAEDDAVVCECVSGGRDTGAARDVPIDSVKCIGLSASGWKSTYFNTVPLRPHQLSSPPPSCTLTQAAQPQAAQTTRCPHPRSLPPASVA